MWQQKEHAYRRIQRDLEAGDLPGVLLMYGREQYLVDWAINRMVSKFINPATKTMDYTTIDEDDLGDRNISDAIISASETLPLFSDKRVIVVRTNKLFSAESGSEVESLIYYIGDIPKTTLLIFRSEEVNLKKKLVATIAKVGRSYEFDGLTREDLSSFISKRFKAAGMAVSNSVMRIIIEKTGYFNRDSNYTLYTLNNDVTKMISLTRADGSTSVTETNVRQTIDGDLESSAIDFMNFLCVGEKERAFMLLNNILDGDNDAFALIAFMVSQFELLLGIRELIDVKVAPSIIQGQLNIPKWRYDKLRPYALRMSRDKIRDILKKIYEIDRNIKTGVLSGRIAIEMIIAEV